MRGVFFPIIISVCLCMGLVYIPKAPAPLPSSTSVEHLLVQEGELKMWIKFLTEEEGKQYLKKDFSGIGVQPVEVIIENGSAGAYLFSPISISLPVIEERQLLKKIFSSALPRQIGFQIASFLFWPFAFPSTLNSLLSHKSYRKAAKELSSKIVKEEQVAPYSTIHRIFFVEKEEKGEKFCISLENTETLESVLFSVNLLSHDLQKIVGIQPPAENYYLTHEG